MEWHASICECIGDVAATLWNRLSVYFPFPLQQIRLVERIDSLVEKWYAIGLFNSMAPMEGYNTSSNQRDFGRNETTSHLSFKGMYHCV